MKILKLKAIDGGYVGICTNEYQDYLRFRITSTSRVLKSIKVSNKINDYESFFALWSRIEPDTNFIVPPMEVKDLSLNTLKDSERLLTGH